MNRTILEARLAAVRVQLPTWEVEALLLTHPLHVRWLTGFTGSFGMALVTAGAALLATDFRYWEQATQQAPTFTLFKWRSAEKRIRQQFLGSVAAQRLGVEASHLTLTEYAQWRRVRGVRWVKLPTTLEPLRAIKDETELAAIRAAAAITDGAMAQVPALARLGMTERELAWALEKEMREAGATGMAFEVIAASGPNAALPHHRPGERRLALGDALVIDMGAQVGGYNSDLTRTFHLGDTPSEMFWHVYQVVQAAQSRALAEMRPDMSGRAIDALAREVIVEAGHGEAFGHSLGHGVGLAIHEEPRLAATNQAAIPAGAVVTVEPGVYRPGWGGVRIEDLVVLGPAGPEPLSHCPKQPVIAV